MFSKFYFFFLFFFCFYDLFLWSCIAKKTDTEKENIYISTAQIFLTRPTKVGNVNWSICIQAIEKCLVQVIFFVNPDLRIIPCYMGALFSWIQI